MESEGPNPLPESIRALLRSAGIDEAQVLDSGAVAADSGEYLMEPQLAVELLADGLRALHSVNPASAGDSHPLTMAELVADAAELATAGEQPMLDPAYAHMDHDRLVGILGDMAAQLGDFPDPLLVITHGRPQTSTLRCEGTRAIGFASWESAAVADPHRDLAHAATAVASSLGPMLVPVLFERYGVRPDPRRIDWWALAQQLTGTAATNP